MRFESAAFKLSHEMTLLVDPGGGRASREFRQFENLCVRGFLAVGALRLFWGTILNSKDGKFNF